LIPLTPVPGERRESFRIEANYLNIIGFSPTIFQIQIGPKKAIRLNKINIFLGFSAFREDGTGERDYGRRK
jgi:hypothetical protein